MRLVVKLTDLDGDFKALVTDFDGLEVNVPLKDSATAKFTLSIHDPVLAKLTCVDTLVNIVYGTELAFYGYVVNTSWNAQEQTVEVNCVDATFKLKHHYHRFGDWVVDYLYPLDGVGLRMILESTVPINPQLDRGVKPNGILWGYDYTTKLPEPANIAVPEVDKRLYLKPIQRGTNVWDSIQNMTESMLGFDWEFQPVDQEHLPRSGVFTPGFICQVNCWDYKGDDLRETVKFHFGWGMDNLENFVYEPDGDALRNYFVQVNPSGERGRADDSNKALAHDEPSWLKYGIFQGWESSGKKESKEALTQRAKAWVDAYADVPEFFSITPKVDETDVPIYLQDFVVGDTIRASARVGYLSKVLDGRIINVQLTQTDKASNTRSTLTLVPPVGSVATEGDEGGSY